MKQIVARACEAMGPFDWLAGIVLSWAVPLNLIWHGHVNYAVSLLLWIVPIFLLLPRLFVSTHQGSKRRHAVYWTAGYIFVLGALLDLAFGHLVLEFDPTVPTQYLKLVRGFAGKTVPIEEFVFYATGGLAIVLVYFWADEFWLAAYNVRQRRPLIPAPGYLLKISPAVIALGSVLVICGVIAKQLNGSAGFVVPIYFTFLILVAFTPAILLFESVYALVNWRAFSFTALYVLLTALVWEVTLGIPRYWWRYQKDAMIGIAVPAWSTVAMFPIEALFVWVAVSFSCVLTYEAVKAYHYDTRSSRERLFGPAPWETAVWGERQ